MTLPLLFVPELMTSVLSEREGFSLTPESDKGYTEEMMRLFDLKRSMRRSSLNLLSRYAFSPSYPLNLCIPSVITDLELLAVRFSRFQMKMN